MSDFYKKYAYFYAKIAHMAAVKKNIPLSLLELNEGQLSVIDPETNRQVGLPRNPRWIRDARFEALKKSIEDAPEMLDLREILVYSLSGIKGKDGRYIVIGGNMRLRALRELGYAEAPCKVLDPATPMEKLREYTIKDNEGFGQNDFDIHSTGGVQRDCQSGRLREKCGNRCRRPGELPQHFLNRRPRHGQGIATGHLTLRSQDRH